MTALETRYALLLLAEESYGAPSRLRAAEARALEDARFGREAAAIESERP